MAENFDWIVPFLFISGFSAVVIGFNLNDKYPAWAVKFWIGAPLNASSSRSSGWIPT